MAEIDENKIKNIKNQKKRIRNEFNNLNKRYIKADKEKLLAVAPLMWNLAHVNITIEDLESDIIENGIKEVYKNGKNQWGTRINPSRQAKDAEIKNKLALQKYLDNFLLGDSFSDLDDGFDDFISG